MIEFGATSGRSGRAADASISRRNTANRSAQFGVTCSRSHSSLPTCETTSSSSTVVFLQFRAGRANRVRNPTGVSSIPTPS